MYFARCPSKRRMTVAQVSRYAWMTTRSSSGSSCVERVVDPTRSQNITVNCRLSASGRAESRVWRLASSVWGLESGVRSPESDVCGAGGWEELGTDNWELTTVVPPVQTRKRP